MLMTIDEMIETAEQHARTVLINEEGAQLSPAFLMESEEERIIVVTPWSNKEERNRSLNVIQLAMKIKKIKQYSVVSESWMATETKGFETGLMPSQRQDRKEVVVIVAVTKIEKKSVMFDIERNDKAIIIDLIKEKEMEGSGVAGELASLLDE